MNPRGDALEVVEDWIFTAIGFFAALFGIVETALHRILTQLGVAANIQSIVILVAMVLFIVAVLRLFGGFFRILLILVLILLMLHILLPNAGL